MSTRRAKSAAVLAALLAPLTAAGCSDTADHLRPAPGTPRLESTTTVIQLIATCTTVEIPGPAAQYHPATPSAWPGAWTDQHGEVIGFATEEDTAIYDSADCALTEGRSTYVANPEDYQP